MNRSKLAASVALLLCIACSANDEPQDRSEETESVAAETGVPPLPSRDEFVQSGLLPAATTRAGLANTLGQPDSVRATAVPNRHLTGLTDTLFAIYYPGLVMNTHRPGGGNDIVSSVEVTENRFLRFPLMGVERSAVESAFGTPHEVRDGRYIYHCGGCMGAENPLELLFAGGRVERVRFTYYVD